MYGVQQIPRAIRYRAWRDLDCFQSFVVHCLGYIANRVKRSACDHEILTFAQSCHQHRRKRVRLDAVRRWHFGDVEDGWEEVGQTDQPTYSTFLAVGQVDQQRHSSDFLMQRGTIGVTLRQGQALSKSVFD